jgi:predicted glycosyltransferase
MVMVLSVYGRRMVVDLNENHQQQGDTTSKIPNTGFAKSKKTKSEAKHD